eukprot:scaffold258921_cov18-Tisochrysis_lutea.AAC.1
MRCRISMPCQSSKRRHRRRLKRASAMPGNTKQAVGVLGSQLMPIACLMLFDSSSIIYCPSLLARKVDADKMANVSSTRGKTGFCCCMILNKAAFIEESLAPKLARKGKGKAQLAHKLSAYSVL